MKKLLLLAALAAGSVFSVSAQSKTTFGARAGVNIASWYATQSGSSVTASSGSITAFSAGVYADAPLGTSFSVQPGIFYSGKGMNSNDGVNTGKIKTAYIQIPVNFLYNVQSAAGKFYFGLGPYAAYGISAKAEDRLNGTKVSIDLEFGEYLKRMDVGLGSLIGFQFSNNVSLNVNYDLGLTNILADSDGTGSSIKNRVFGISVGYAFK